MEEDTRTPEGVYQSAANATLVHFFMLANQYKTRGRRLGLSYARIWAESFWLYETLYEDAMRAAVHPLHLTFVSDGVDDACNALASSLKAPLYDFRGVAYFDQVSKTWQVRIKHLVPQWDAQEPARLTGYPAMAPESFHFRANAAMAEVPLFLMDLNGVIVRPYDLETIRQRVKHIAARHLPRQEAAFISDYRHGVEIAMFCVEQIIAEQGAMPASRLLELLEPRLEDFWIPQRSPFADARNQPFDPADEAHQNPGHWPKFSFGL